MQKSAAAEAPVEEPCWGSGSPTAKEHEPMAAEPSALSVGVSHLPEVEENTRTQAPAVLINAADTGPPAALPWDSLLPSLRDEPFALLLTGPDGVEQVRFDESTIVLGRGNRVDVRLSDAAVSRCHALLQRVGPRLLFFDLCSRTGILHNGERQSLGWLARGDVLEIGPFAIRWGGDADNVAHRSSDSPDRLTGDGGHQASARPDVPPKLLFGRAAAALEKLPDLRLRVCGPTSEPPVDVLLDRPILLAGRSSRCKLQLCDERIARVHAVFLRSRDGVAVVDLARRDCLLVNGRAKTRTLLRVGDDVRIGPYHLLLVEEVREEKPTDGTRSNHSLGVADATEALRPEHAAPAVGPSPLSSSSMPSTSKETVASLLAVLTKLQQELQEQSQHQMDLLTRLADAVRRELEEDGGNHLPCRKEEEMFDDVLQAHDEAARGAGQFNRPRPHVPKEGKALAVIPVPVLRKPTKPVEASPIEEQESCVRIAQRLAQLQRERSSGFERLLRLFGG
jgi:pSer/pThr/pTyr-binding forkhead associated (FHA) protein